MKPELVDYLRQKAKETFDIETNNCYRFTNECWKIYFGCNYSDKYFNITGIKQTDYDTLVEACDNIPLLIRSEKPQEGHLVAVKVPGDTSLGGYALGFCVGDLSVFLSTKGVKYLPTKIVSYSWRNKHDI